MTWEVVSSSTVLATVAATLLAWQLAELASVAAAVIEGLAGWVRRLIAVHRVRSKWARFRRENPEYFNA